MNSTIPLPSSNPYSAFQSALKSELASLLNRYADQRAEQQDTEKPIPPSQLSSAIDALASNLPPLPSAAAELQRLIVSSVLTSIVSETANPGKIVYPQPVHRQLLHDALDISLVFVEQNRAPAELTLSCIEEILETAIVEEAERIFTYLETRVNRLTVDMLPDRGKGLIFLRMQNSLLRRLSKSLHTVFCGRILSFLSSVFPIAEKSGVNLRGAFNTGNVTNFDLEVERKEVEPETEPIKPVVTDLNPSAEQATADSSTSMDNKPPLVVESETTAPLDPPDLNQDHLKVKQESPEIIEESPEATAARLRAKAEEQEARAKAKAASKAAADKREFYLRFWALQSLLSNPPDLFKGWQPDPNPTSTSSTTQSNSFSYLPSRPISTSVATAGASSIAPQQRSSSAPREVESAPSTANLKRLKEGVTKTLEVFSRMTKKEKELGTHSKKSKIDERNLLDVKEQYFFPKYLTKSNLLDLEVADSYFRRQILTQFLIILQYIRGFSLEERNKRSALPRSNRVNDVPYVYQPRDEVWVLKLNSEVWKTLYATPPNGEIFAMTIQQILIREHSWIMWKAGSCPSFERPSMTETEIAAAQAGYKRITVPPMRFPHLIGTPALSKLWSNNVTPESIESVALSTGVPDLNSLHAKIMLQDEQLNVVKKSLLEQDKSEPELSKQAEAQAIEERKSSLSWRALRVAQSTHLQLFGKIGLPGDVSKLMTLIEEAKARPNPARQLPPSSSTQTVSPAVTPATGRAADTKDAEGDAVHLLTSSENHDGQPVIIDHPDIVMLDGESIETPTPMNLKSVILSEPEEDVVPVAEVLPSLSAAHDSVPPHQLAQPQARAPSVPRFNNGHRHHHHSPVPRAHLSAPTHRTNTDSEIDQMIRRVEASAAGSPALVRSHSSSGGDYRNGLHTLPSNLPTNPTRIVSNGVGVVGGKRTADDEGLIIIESGGVKKSKI